MNRNAGDARASPASGARAAPPDLDVDRVTKRFGAHVAVDSLSLAVAHGSFFSILGPSGCGKTTLLRMIAGFAAPDEGDVRIGGRSMRGVAPNRRPVNMVFQHLALFPMMSVGENIGYGLARRGVARERIRERVDAMLSRVGLPGAAGKRVDQLSGGQKQRVAIARALAGEPEVMIADEPVSALDVSVQASVINLLNEIQAEQGTTLVFISHDLSVVRYLADHVVVMYLGTVAEVGSAEDVFKPPYHPYTEALLSAVPVPDPDASGARIVLDGPLPDPTEPLSGCPFSSRCPRRIGRVCDETPPPEQHLANGHRITCHIPVEELARLGGSVTRTSADHS